MNYYIIRFFDSKENNSFLSVSVSGLFKRGMDLSQYKEVYESFLTSNDGNLPFDDFSLAIQRLQISVIPDELPCRNKEREEIENHIRDVLVYHRTKPPLYICGLPGTGKTATVLSCINRLRKEAENGNLPEFDFLEINCLRLKHPNDACK
jgi:hypothetical protein